MVDSASMGTSYTHQGSLNSEELTKGLFVRFQQFYEQKLFYRPLPNLHLSPHPSNLDFVKDVFYNSINLTNLRRRFKTKIIIMAK